MNCSGGVVERDARPPIFSKGNVRYLPFAADGLPSDKFLLTPVMTNIHQNGRPTAKCSERSRPNLGWRNG